MSKESLANVGEVFFSYAQERGKTKESRQMKRRRRFVPDFQDIDRLLPRLRHLPRRGGRL